MKHETPASPSRADESELDRRLRSATAEIFDLNARLARADAQLREANALQARFLEDMAHEIRNPLCVILGYAGHLHEELGKLNLAPATLQAVGALSRNAENLRELIETLMDAARLEEGKVRLKRQNLPARDFSEEAVDAHRLSADRKGISLSADCPVPLRVSADRVRLRQILSNLVGNAIKFTPKGGRVIVRASVEGKDVRFCVEDTGKGMSSQEAERIFERFYQAESALVEHGGLGLGLHIVHGLVTLHGGRIWVESAPGAGARFNFTIPRAGA